MKNIKKLTILWSFDNKNQFKFWRASFLSTAFQAKKAGNLNNLNFIVSVSSLDLEEDVNTFLSSVYIDNINLKVVIYSKDRDNELMDVVPVWYLFEHLNQKHTIVYL